MWDKIKQLFNHERYQMIAIITVCQLLIWNYGCQSKVASIYDPNLTVTRGQLHIEVDTFLANAELRYKQLDQQDQLKNALFQSLVAYTATGGVNPAAMLTTIVGILGIGATVDNVRKRKEIKRLEKS